jgi:hypothetical protein
MTHSTTPLGQLPVWDQRELMSLYYPLALKGQTSNEHVRSSTNNLQINFSTMLETLDCEINNLFSYIGLTVQPSRLENWKHVYNIWKTNNDLDFYKNLDVIIDCILHNVEYDLSQHNMSFAKEVVIASRLLYEHNLALRSNGKNSLSHSTKQWSEIIEPNVYHDLTKQ